MQIDSCRIMRRQFKIGRCLTRFKHLHRGKSVYSFRVISTRNFVCELVDPKYTVGPRLQFGRNSSSEDSQLNFFA